MEGEQISSGASYAFKILEKWFRFRDIAEEVHASSLSDNADKDYEKLYTYISQMVSLWLELYPKIVGRSDLKEFEKQFVKYKQYYHNPRLLMEDKNSADCSEMELTLRDALEKLGITKW